MIGRLKGTLVLKQPPWAKPRACEPLARERLRDRQWVAGPDYREPAKSHEGWQRAETRQ